MAPDRAPALRDQALRELASRFSPGQSVAAQAAAVRKMVRRYEIRWRRADQHRPMPAAYVGTSDEWLFAAFAVAGGSVPSGWTQLRQIFGSNCSDEAIPAGRILISPAAVPGMVEMDHQERAMAETARDNTAIFDALRNTSVVQKAFAERDAALEMLSIQVRWPLPYVQGETPKGSGGDYSVRFLNHRALGNPFKKNTEHVDRNLRLPQPAVSQPR